MILKTRSLSPNVLNIVRDKGTEQPFSGEYTGWGQPGTYLCRQCGLALFRAPTKFHCGCGWPSFDESIAGAIKQQPDVDGRRTEILCARCQAHLGHVFHGENYTAKNTRHCVNSLSLDQVADQNVTDSEEAIVAAGCFWGVEYYFKKLVGILKIEVGYSGGQVNYPNYQQVCAGHTGHVEAVRILYDVQKLNYETLIKCFFEIHDPTQTDGQGPDIGEQYRSVIFYHDTTQQKTAQALKTQLENKGLVIATQILPAGIFWRAETYHQDYYQKAHKQPYCHQYIKRF